MTLKSLRRAALAVTMAGGIAVAAITAGAAAQAAARTPDKVYLVTCEGKGVVRPSTYTIACADGNDYLSRLSWSSWSSSASGKGKDGINTCVPSCVAGKFKYYPVNVSLSDARSWPHHAGQHYFAKMTLTYTGAVPKGYHRTRVITLLP